MPKIRAKVKEDGGEILFAYQAGIRNGQETFRFFRRVLRQPHIVRGYHGGPHVRYVLAENPTSFWSIENACGKSLTAQGVPTTLDRDQN